MKDTDKITVYWTPANFNPHKESFTMLYSKPQSLTNYLNEKRLNNTDLFRCPAHRDFTSNIFVFKSNLSDKHVLPIETLTELQQLPTGNDLNEKITINSNGIVPLTKVRPNSFTDYSNLAYGLEWLFFSDEPLLASFSDPYLFTKPVAPGAFLTPGKFDIGKWYRPFGLDYHIPLDSKFFQIEENDPLFYVQFYTDKKIELKQYINNEKLHALTEETRNSISRYGKFKSLTTRYKMAENTSYSKQILTEIKKNLIEG